MTVAWGALIVAIVALVQTRRVRTEVARLRAELTELRREAARLGGRPSAGSGPPEELPMALHGIERAKHPPQTGAAAASGVESAGSPGRASGAAVAGAGERPSARAALAAASSSPGALDLETRVGTTWALRLGLGALAIAVALFARSVVPSLGAGAKVALAYAGALALFAVGRIFEARQERFARPVMAAALAIGFFVSFASHFVPAMRALPLVPSLVWMGLGVAAVLALAERWGSEPTAGLAIFLGHVSAYVAGGVTDVYSLVVILFLSAAAVVLLWRHDWLPLSLFALTAAYGSHLLWAVADHGPAAAAPGLGVNLLFVTSYYALFLAADLLWWRRREGGSAAAPALGRALGPANVVMLATLATFLYLSSPEPAWNPAWFFFGIGALQVGLAPVYRRLGNADHGFYPALGAVVITLGFAAALDGLTLNLVLAIEAVALLLTAHATRLRVFHLLAQAALAANFVHYWTTARFDDLALAAYIGGLAIAAAYMTQAVLEESWYGTREGRAWRGPRGDGATGRVAAAFDVAFARLAPWLAYLHAGAGALLIAHQSHRHLAADPALVAIAAGMALLAGAGVARRSGPLVLAAATLQAAITALAIMAPPGAWELAALTGVGLGVPVLVVVGAQARRFGEDALEATLVLTQLALLSALVLPLVPYTPVFGMAVLYPYVAWIAVLAVAALYIEAARVALAGLGSAARERLAAPARAGAALTGLLTAVAAVAATERLLGADVAAPVWTSAWAAALIGVAAWRRQPAFTLAGVALLVGGDAYWLVGRRLAGAMVGSTAAAAALTVLALGVGALQDRFGSRRFVGSRPGTGAAAAYLPYLLGSIIALAWCEARLPEAWSSVWLTAVPAALVLVTRTARERRGAIVAVLVMLGALLDQLAYAVSTDAVGLTDLLAPGLVIATAALALERVLASARATPRPGAGRVAGLSLLATATIVALATVHASWWLGGPRTTIGWSLVGGALMVLGFAAKSADHRRVALAVLGVTAIRVFAVDTRGLSDAGKTLAFLALGLSLVTVAWLYSRFGRRMRDWL